VSLLTIVWRRQSFGIFRSRSSPSSMSAASLFLLRHRAVELRIGARRSSLGPVCAIASAPPTIAGGGCALRVGMIGTATMHHAAMLSWSTASRYRGLVNVLRTGCWGDLRVAPPAKAATGGQVILLAGGSFRPSSYIVPLARCLLKASSVSGWPTSGR